MTQPAAEWLAPSEAFSLVADAYRHIQPVNAEAANRWARNAVLSALARGQCRARAIEASLYLGEAHAVLAILLTKSLAPLTALDANHRLSVSFWQNLQLCGQADIDDWDSGKLRFSGTEPITKQPIQGHALGVELERHGLPLIGPNCAYASTLAGTKRRTGELATQDDLTAWVLSQPSMTADAAFRLYKALPNPYRIKREQFRQIWKELKGTKRGRPSA